MDSHRTTSRDDAVELITQSLARGINYFDTAPMYGLGESERRLGLALKGVERDRFVISSKVGRVLPEPTSPKGWEFDFSRRGIRASLQGSLGRLGLTHIDILYIHDPDGDILFRHDDREYYDQALTEAMPELLELKEAGAVQAIGVGMNQWEMELRFAREGQFDCFLLAGRYTLLDQSALVEFLPYCEAHAISVVVGGPFNSGILAAGPRQGATFNYAEAPPTVIEKVERIDGLCARYEVPLKAAALQFILAHPAVTSVIPGARSVDEMENNLEMAGHPIPPELWRDLKEAGLIHADAPVPTEA